MSGDDKQETGTAHRDKASSYTLATPALLKF